MRAAEFLAPITAAPGRLISAERRIVAAERGRVELDREQLTRSVEISEDEILDDLLYPADRRAVRSEGSESGLVEPR